MGNFQQWFNKTYNIIKDTNMLDEKDNEEKEDPFARNKAYIEHRKKFPYYPDKHKEDKK